MEEDMELRHIFTSLCTLSEQGPLPVQAYSMLVRRMCPEALAEELHRGWLADHRFAPTAANIILHVCTSDSQDVALSSSCLAHVLNDYRLRAEIRQESRFMYRNSIRALFHLYPVYRQLDACFSKCFIQPMFTCLEELFELDPQSEDYETVGTLLGTFGRILYDLRPIGVERLIVRVRECIVSDKPSQTHRRMFLHVFDLHTYQWNEVRIPNHYIIGKLESSLYDEPRSELSPFVRPKRLRESSTSSSLNSKTRDTTSSPSVNIQKMQEVQEEEGEEEIPLENKETAC